MLKEEIVANHKYFAKIGDEYYRVRTAQKPFAKDGYVKCKKLHSYDKEKIYVSFDNLYTSIPKDKLDVLKKREEEYKEKERKKLEQRQRDKLRAEEERKKRIAIHMAEEAKKLELAMQEFKKDNPDFVWKYPQVSMEWKDKVIDFIKGRKIYNSVEEIDYIFFELPKEDYFPWAWEPYECILEKVNENRHFRESLLYDIYDLIDEDAIDCLVELNGLKDVNDDLWDYMVQECYQVPEIELSFDVNEFISEVFSMITIEELYDAVMYAKKN